MNLETQSKLQILENLDKLSNLISSIDRYEIKNTSVDVTLVDNHTYAELDLEYKENKKYQHIHKK